MTLDNISTGLLLGTWVVYLVWELTLLVIRYRDQKLGVTNAPRLISGVAKDRAWRWTSLVYAWCSMASHWWWNGPDVFPAWVGLIFWGIPVCLLAWDISELRSDMATWPKWKRYARWPLTWALVGVLAGHFLFPQSGITPWSFKPLN
jgi:hypothetical protein